MLTKIRGALYAHLQNDPDGTNLKAALDKRPDLYPYKESDDPHTFEIDTMIEYNERETDKFIDSIKDLIGFGTICCLCAETESAWSIKISNGTVTRFTGAILYS